MTQYNSRLCKGYLTKKESDGVLHQTPRLGQIALTQPGGVLGHCPVEKEMIGPLSANQMGWHLAVVASVP